MELSEVLALITAIALIATLGVLIKYTIATHRIAEEAKKQRMITEEALQLQKDVRRDDLQAMDLRFETGGRLEQSTRHIIQLTNRGPDIMGWSVTPVERPDAIWAVSPLEGDFWKSGSSRYLQLDRVEGVSQGDSEYWFRINYRTGIERDSTTKCFRITRTGVVPETCPESKKTYVTGGKVIGG